MMYTASDVDAAADAKAISILSRTAFVARQASDEKGAIRRKPPIEIAHPFGDMLEADKVKTHDSVHPNEIVDFVIEGGTLLGDRAFLTVKPPLLLTDSMHPRHLPWIFESVDRRNFEGVHLDQVEGGYCLQQNGVVYRDIPGTVCALTGMEYNNYGAFLVRMLPKIINMRNLGIEVNSIIAPSNRWQKHILQCFGIDLGQVVSHERGKAYRAEKLVALGMRSSEMYMDDISRDLFKNYAVEVSKNSPVGDSERIYVSRLSQSKRNPNHRRLVNEERLAIALEQRGFQIFAPEEHSFEDQVRTFAKARVVVGPSGAGMFNTIFCKADTLVVSLEPMMNWIILHSNLFASSGVNYALVVGGADKADASIQKRWSADVDCVLSLLKRCGV